MSSAQFLSAVRLEFGISYSPYEPFNHATIKISHEIQVRIAEEVHLPFGVVNEEASPGGCSPVTRLARHKARNML